MTVTAQLLSALVKAQENSQNLDALKRELVSLALKESGEHSKSYRFHEYNIQVTPHPYRGPAVTVLRAQDLTPELKNGEEVPRCDGYSQQGLEAAAGPKVPRNAVVDEELMREALDALMTGFTWSTSSKSPNYWADLTNRLRRAAGWPLLKY